MRVAHFGNGLRNRFGLIQKRTLLAAAFAFATTGQAQTLAVGTHAGLAARIQQQDERIPGVGLDLLGHELCNAVV
jgi:hypothetical protein